jgi:2-iminoacetate synthase
MNIEYLKKIPKELENITAGDVEVELAATAGKFSLERLAAFISPVASKYLEPMAQIAHHLTVERFGKTIQLYAPLYLSNYCVNNCLYCGYNASTKASRARLTIDEALSEAAIIASEGFRHILLVSGEDKKFISACYLAELAQKLRKTFSSVSIEIYQMSKDEYQQLCEAGVDGITLYQETYDRDEYAKWHSGPKADYDRRLLAHDDAAQAGMRRLGIGALLGLADWRFETLALGLHANYLMKKYWRSLVSFSFPRLRPATGVDYKFESATGGLSDKDLVQMILALRLCFADAALYLSTRENAALRDHLVSLGITHISAGSKTNPGGYSGTSDAVEQFEVNDARTPAEVAAMLRQKGLEPVWKDWDAAFAN